MIAKIAPNRVRRTYRGGGRIDAFTGFRPPDDGECRPEDWTASTTQAFNGAAEIAGEGLGRLEDGRPVIDVAGPLPILVKLLDADERLVIQAHPTVPCAKRLFNSSVGKTECWYFLPGTADDACVYLGFKPGVTRERWEQAVLDFSHKEHKEHKDFVDSVSFVANANPLLSFLHRIPVKAGDFVFVDGGMPHAIGAGCFMVELQEPSDLMVVAERVTPSGRMIPDGKMHGGVGWERMHDVYSYEGFAYDELCARYVRRGCRGGAFRIVGPELTDRFSMWKVGAGGSLGLEGGQTAVCVVLAGEGTVNGTPASAGDRLLVMDEARLSADGTVEMVVCFR